MHLNNLGRTGRGRDEKHVHEPDVLAQLAEQPARSSRLPSPPHGFLLVNLRQRERRDEGNLPFFHAMRAAARPVEMMLLMVWARGAAQAKRFKALLFGEGACRQRAESLPTGLASRGSTPLIA